MDVKSPRCEMIGCRKQPCCGFPGLKPRFCSEHKQDGMLNLKVCVLSARVAVHSSTAVGCVGCVNVWTVHPDLDLMFFFCFFCCA